MTDKQFEAHCGWFEKRLRIVDKKGKLAPLVLNPIQMKLERWKAECFEKGEPAFAIVLKARQEGVSTWAEATMFHDGREMDTRTSIVVAHNEASTRRIFEMARRFLKYFPTEIETEKSSARALHFADTQSEFIVQTAGAEDSAGRAFSCQALHVSELDYCPDPYGLLAAAMQTIPDAYPAFVVLESTAAGPGGAMEGLWRRAVEGKSAFVPFFFPWHEDPTYRLSVTFENVVKYLPDDFKRQNFQWIKALKRQEESRGKLGRLGPSERGGSAEGSEEDVHGRDPGERGAGEVAGGSGPVHEGPAGSEGTPGGGPVHRLLEAGRTPPGPDGAVHGVPLQAGRGVFREDAPLRGDKGADHPGGTGSPDEPPRRLGREIFDHVELFKASLTSYEIGLWEEFKLDYEQLLWRRYCLETKCSGNESTMKREYPARPEEAFEAAEGAVLDQAVLARWVKEAEASVPSRGSMKALIHPTLPLMVEFDSSDKHGKIEVYEPPRHDHRYVLGLDCSNGIPGGDATVGCVLDVDTGIQAAEYRAVIDPDLAVDQVEALAIWYNKALCAVETNGGFGGPYLRHLLDRKSVPVYERIAFDKIERVLVKRPGWDTSSRTRPLLVAAMREAVRKETIRIKSRDTLSECRTLHEKKAKARVSATGDVIQSGVGTIEARPGHRDDGFFGMGIALMVANGLLQTTRRAEEAKRKESPFLKRLNRMAKMRDRALGSGVFPVSHVRAGSQPKFTDEGMPAPRSRLG